MEVYGKGVINDGNVRKRCRLLNEGRMNVHDVKSSNLYSHCYNMVNLKSVKKNDKLT